MSRRSRRKHQAKRNPEVVGTEVRQKPEQSESHDVVAKETPLVVRRPPRLFGTRNRVRFASVISCLSLVVAALALWDAHSARLADATKSERDVATAKQREFYQCFMLGESLWTAEQDFVEYPAKRPRYDLPVSQAQLLSIQPIQGFAGDLGLDVSETIRAVFDSKLAIYDQVLKNHYSENGVSVAAQQLADQIEVKYSMNAKSAFDFGCDSGWLLFLNKAMKDNEDNFKEYAATQPMLGSMGDNYSGPMEDVLLRLNTQADTWKFGVQFGHTHYYPEASHMPTTTIFADQDRDTEIKAFVGVIEARFRDGRF